MRVHEQRKRSWITIKIKMGGSNENVMDRKKEEKLSWTVSNYKISILLRIISMKIIKEI